MADENTGGASGAGRNARNDLLTSITQLTPLLFGSGKQTVSDTTTSGKYLTPQQLMALTNSLMAGNQGLASVLLPQRQAGLYNSPINTLLVQRLSSEIAAQVAAHGTPTTQTSTRTSQTAAPTIGGVSAGAAGAGLLGALQVASMISKAMDTSLGRQVLGQVTGSASAFKDAIASAAMSVDPSLIAAGNPLLESLGVFGKSTPGAFTGAEGLITKSLDDVAGLGMNQVAALGAVDDVAANIGNSLSDFGMDAWGTDFIGVDLGDSLSGFLDGVPGSSWLSAGMDLLNGDWGGALGTTVGSFFGGPIGGWVGGMLGDPIEDVGKFVFEDIGGGIVDVGEDILGGIGDAIGGVGDAVGDFFGGGCFLTTACMQRYEQDFDDNCRELVAMRKLRDEYVASLEEGPAVIQEYYKTAPSYVHWINAREDADGVWSELYDKYLLPAVEAVEKEHMHKAYEIYVDMVHYVKEKVEEDI